MSLAMFTVEMTPPITPNQSVHFYTRGKRVKEFRRAAFLAAASAKNTPGGNPICAFEGYYEPIWLDAVILWGKGRKQLDNDNAIASLKPLIDGISDALWDGRDAHVRIGTVVQQTGGSGITVVTLRTEGIDHDRGRLLAIEYEAWATGELSEISDEAMCYGSAKYRTAHPEVCGQT